MEFGVFAMGVGKSFKDEQWLVKFSHYPIWKKGYL
jgi:hypothetical protein